MLSFFVRLFTIFLSLWGGTGERKFVSGIRLLSIGAFGKRKQTIWIGENDKFRRLPERCGEG